MPNTLTNIMPKILAMGIRTLRQQVLMTRLVNSSYSAEAAQKGATIDIPVPVATTAVNVTPAATPPTPGDRAPELVQVQLNNWKKNDPFYLTDKELVEIDRNRHFIPMQVAEAIKALVNSVNVSIHSKYKGTTRGIYGFVGTAGTTPFASTVADATNARKLLNQQLCPRTDRNGVLNFDAEANALALSAFSDVDKTGEQGAKIAGEIGRKFGILWVADDHVTTHTAGTINATGSPSGRVCAVNNGAGYAIGVNTINVDNGASTAVTGTIVLGDIISFANHAQTYVVIENTGSAQYAAGAYTFATNAIAGLRIYPALKAALVDNEVATVRATHVVNLAFHRDAFAFASRALVSEVGDLALGSQMLSTVDPISGLALRLEVSRQYKQVMWEFDILWGDDLVMPDLAVRIAG